MRWVLLASLFLGTYFYLSDWKEQVKIYRQLQSEKQFLEGSLTRINKDLRNSDQEIQKLQELIKEKLDKQYPGHSSKSPAQVRYAKKAVDCGLTVIKAEQNPEEFKIEAWGSVEACNIWLTRLVDKSSDPLFFKKLSAVRDEEGVHVKLSVAFEVVSTQLK